MTNEPKDRESETTDVEPDPTAATDAEARQQAAEERRDMMFGDQGETPASEGEPTAEPTAEEPAPADEPAAEAPADQPEPTDDSAADAQDDQPEPTDDTAAAAPAHEP
ncbi:MAG: cytochrome c1, partial [Maricaulaceae bacterium]